MTKRTRTLRGLAILTVGASTSVLALTGVGGAAAAAATVKAASVHVYSPGIPRGLKPEHARATKGGGGISGLYLHSTAASGAVSVTPKVYLVFWGSQWQGSGDPAHAASALQTFFRSLYGSADNWGTILTQYCSGAAVGATTCGAGSTLITHPQSSMLAGFWFDSAGAAPGGAGTKQLAAEAAAAAAHFGNLTPPSNDQTQYVIATPSGAHPTGFGTSYCAWHSSAATSAGTIAYTNLPYVPDLGTGACTTLAPAAVLDGYFSSATHEYAETVTDLWPSLGWLTSKGSEIGDLCVNMDALLSLPIGNGVFQTFDVQGLWSNGTGGCVTHQP